MPQTVIAEHSDSKTESHNTKGDQTVPSYSLKKFRRAKEPMRSVLVHLSQRSIALYLTVTASLGCPIS